MSRKPNNMTLYEFKGTWRQIGQQYGEACRDGIKAMTSYWKERVFAPVIPNVSLDKLMETSVQFIEPIEAFAPEFMEELKGIAEGANIPLNEVLMQNGAFELDVAAPVYFGGCTSFAATGKATKDGKTVAGQNFDWCDGSEFAAMKIVPDNGPAILGAAIVGQLIMFGLNDRGISHFANELVYPKSVFGVPSLVIGQKALSQVSIPKALRCIAQSQSAIALNHLIAGKDGDMIDIEATPDKNGYILPDRDILTHANHFQTPFLQQHDMADQIFFVDTYLRDYRMKQLMEDHYGDLDAEIMMEFLRDQRGYPTGICGMYDPELPLVERGGTIFSICTVPEEGKAWIAPNPFEYEYREFTLG